MNRRRLFSFLLVGVCAVMLAASNGYAQAKKSTAGKTTTKTAETTAAPKAKMVDLNTAGGVWTMWSTSRVYPGIAAGTHQFDVRCATDSGTVQINAGVASNVSVIELK